MPATTRDRIVDEAMRLFGGQGYKATTIVQIEAAAGLTPGAGGLYHHFSSKEAVLRAGIERQLSRLEALRDIRGVLTPLDDLHAELSLTARYVLTELDNEAELLRILASEARNRPQLLTEAIEQLVGSTFAGFAGWLTDQTDPPLSLERANAIAAIGLGALFSSRLLDHVLGVTVTIDDEHLVQTWVQMLASAITAQTPPNPTHPPSEPPPH